MDIYKEFKKYFKHINNDGDEETIVYMYDTLASVAVDKSYWRHFYSKETKNAFRKFIKLENDGLLMNINLEEYFYNENTDGEYLCENV